MTTIREKLRHFFGRRQHAYRATFNGGLAHLVLEDLAKFCRANETTFHPDSRQHALLDGRREVWLRISQHLQLSEEELWSLYTGDAPDPRARGVAAEPDEL